MQQLETTFIISQFLLVRNPGIAYLGPLFHSPSSKELTRTVVSSQGSTGEGPTLRTEDLSCLLTVDQRSLSFPCHVGLCSVAACFTKACKSRRQQSATKMEVTIFCNPIIQVISHHLSYSAHQKQVTMPSPNSKRRGLYKGVYIYYTSIKTFIRKIMNAGSGIRLTWV